MNNYMFRPGLTVKARISNDWEMIELSNVRVVGACGRAVIVAGDFAGKTYYDTMTALELTFLFPENPDSDKGIIQNRLWHNKPEICL